MQKVAYALALLVAFFIWQKIGGIGGLVVAVLAVGVIQILFLVIIAAVSAPFRSAGPDSSSHTITDNTSPAAATRPLTKEEEEANARAEEAAKARPDRDCPSCGKRLSRLQVERMIGNPEYNEWAREGFCSLQCFDSSKSNLSTGSHQQSETRNNAKCGEQGV